MMMANLICGITMYWSIGIEKLETNIREAYRIARPTIYRQDGTPMHGVYSSSSTSVLQAQLNEAKAANIELLVIPFTISQKEAQSLSPYVMTEFHSRKFNDLNLPKLLKYAEKEGMKVGFLIEEFRGRTVTKFSNK